MNSINFIKPHVTQQSVRRWKTFTISAVFFIFCAATWILLPQLITLRDLAKEKAIHTGTIVQFNNTVAENAQKKLRIAELKRRMNHIERLTKNPRFPLENLTFMASVLNADLGIQSVTWQGKSLTAVLNCSNSDAALNAVHTLKKSGHFAHLKLVALARGAGNHTLQATIQGKTRVA